jgi:hypothetical protein
MFGMGFLFSHYLKIASVGSKPLSFPMVGCRRTDLQRRLMHVMPVSGCMANPNCVTTATSVYGSTLMKLAKVSLTLLGQYHTTDLYSVARKVWVIVIDGVTIGHPCCAVHNCFTPLASNRDRFCPIHTSQYSKICAIVGCSNSITAGSLVCDDQTHRDFERIHRERGQARFQLKERLERARVTHPNDALAEEHEIRDGVDEYAINHPDEDPLKHTSKIRAKFTRDRTHNEQVITSPCGIIIARETFYGAEGVASVVVCEAIFSAPFTEPKLQEMIKRTFRGDIKPDHIFYDNNCMLAKVVKGDPFFSNIALSVDVFHFKSKHSVTDTFCQVHCNPAAFPELISDDGKGWYFNSSIAEQTNVWIGGYHSICREMLVDKYNFFLDEMILRRNSLTRARLEKQGHSPETWPLT